MVIGITLICMIVLIGAICIVVAIVLIRIMIALRFGVCLGRNTIPIFCHHNASLHFSKQRKQVLASFATNAKKRHSPLSLT